MLLNYTVENVAKGHPDKLADLISDKIVTEALKYDKHAHVAVECLVKDNVCVLGGEVTDLGLDFAHLADEVYEDVGYTPANVINILSLQHPRLSDCVDRGGAGDQGIMYGYACDTAPNYMPLGCTIAQNIISAAPGGPDGKTQVTIKNGKVTHIVLSMADSNHKDLMQYILPYTNETVKVESFSGGTFVDCGLTGRKIAVDSYGGLVRMGGGAFSGKDPTKMDRSAAYMCRYVAKYLVSKGMTSKIEIAVAYAFGEAWPVMLETSDPKLTPYVRQYFDFRPAAIIERLDLLNVDYYRTAAYGHFGRTDIIFPWENV